MSLQISRGVRVWVAAALLLPAAAVLNGSDWPDWRGPARTGASTETGLPDKWSTAGENLAWRVPIGGRSSPVVFGDHLYLQTSSGRGRDPPGADHLPQCRHRQAALGASLQPLHQRRARPSHRLVLAHRRHLDRQCLRDQRRRAADVAVAATASCSGNAPWPKSSACGRPTADACRPRSSMATRSSSAALTFMWGAAATGAHRFLSFDKKTGRTNLRQLARGPADRHDLRQRLHHGRQWRPDLLLGRQRRRHARDQGQYRGEDLELARQPARSQYRGARHRQDIIVTHSEENLGSSEMGMVAAVPMASKGDLTDKDARWVTRGVQAGYASPVTDGERALSVSTTAVC